MPKSGNKIAQGKGSPRGNNFHKPFPIPYLLWPLLAATALMGLAVELLLFLSPEAGADWLTPFFSLSYEGNFPTWLASCLLFSNALLLTSIFWDQRPIKAQYGSHWLILGMIFFYMSLDEAVGLHEHLGGLFKTGGLLYFDWVIPAGAFLLVLGIFFLPFLKNLPSSFRKRFIFSGLVYILGALFMELPLGYWTERYGSQNLTYALIDFVEESLELLGLGLFLLALWDYSKEVPWRSV